MKLPDNQMELKFSKKTQLYSGYVNIKENTLWYWFSRYIRMRDSDEYGMVTCCTCGKRDYWKTMDCGHYISRKHKATKYHELNNHAQCKRCNDKRYGKGEQALYGQFVDKKYGKGSSDTLIALSKVLKAGVKPFDYKNLSNLYRKKSKELAKKKGIIL